MEASHQAHQRSAKMKRQILVLINPFAGLGRGRTIWIDEIQPRILEAGWKEEDLQVRVTTGPEHVRSLLTEKADMATEEGHWTIMILGGNTLQYAFGANQSSSLFFYSKATDWCMRSLRRCFPFAHHVVFKSWQFHVALGMHFVTLSALELLKKLFLGFFQTRSVL